MHKQQRWQTVTLSGLTVVWSGRRTLQDLSLSPLSHVSLCDSDVAARRVPPGRAGRRGVRGGERGAVLSTAPLTILPTASELLALSLSLFPFLFLSESRRVSKWSGPGKHGWIPQSPQLSLQVRRRFLQEPRGAGAGCELPDSATKKLWVEKRDNRGVGVTLSIFCLSRLSPELASFCL